MTSTRTRLLTIFAPAKINLYLHVTGRLDNGYHMLDSLVAFMDIGDEVRIEPAHDFSFQVQGPFAGGFTAKELDSSPNSANLAVQAVWALARAAQKTPHVKITLTKALPLASGLGGGSSDAASVLWGLSEWWELSRQAQHYLPPLMATLGADVPVCLNCRPARVRGIGEILDPAPPMGETPVLLVHPGKPCNTGQVFARYAGHFRQPQKMPDNLEHFETLIEFLRAQHNDLYEPACAVVPEIRNVIHALKIHEGCRLARMCGAGASCFGLFESAGLAENAARLIAFENPDWWVRTGWLGRPERY